MGAEDLIANGQDVAVVAYHISDVFENPYSLAKQNYYNVNSLPTAIFDGDIWSVGGNNSTSLYETYLPLYDERINILSDFSFDIQGSNSQLTDYVVDITVEKVAVNNIQNLRLMVALTESEILYYWMGQEYVNHSERLMFPGANGTQLDFSSGDDLSFSFSFSLDTEWEQENCELVAWVQDFSTKEVQQTAKRSLSEFGGFPDQDVAIKHIYSPVTLCNNSFEPAVEVTNLGINDLVSLDVIYQVDDEPEISYGWTGNIPYSESEVIDLPDIDYSVINSGTFTVHLENPNGQEDEFLYNNMRSTTILEAENVSSPVTLVLKLDDFPEQTSWELLGSDGIVLYSGGNYPDPGIFITETFDLAETDCYTFKIYDSYGDGLTGTGLYKLMYGNTIFQTGKEFGFKDEVEFGIGLTDAPDILAKYNTRVFPNPVSGILNIETNKPCNVEFLDLNGKAILSQSVFKDNQQVDVSNLPSGIYYLRIDGENGVEFRKIVVSR